MVACLAGGVFKHFIFYLVAQGNVRSNLRVGTLFMGALTLSGPDCKIAILS